MGWKISLGWVVSGLGEFISFLFLYFTPLFFVKALAPYVIIMQIYIYTYMNIRYTPSRSWSILLFRSLLFFFKLFSVFFPLMIDKPNQITKITKKN